MKRPRSLAEMTMEDREFFDQDEMNMFGDLISEEFAAAVFGDDYQHFHSSSSLSPTLTFSPLPLELEATPTKQFKPPEKGNSGTTVQDCSSSQGQNVNQHYGSKSGQGKRKRNISQDHIIAERKRREKLSQQFIALTALVPGLKKLDKTSVLGDSINYIKQLQERMKRLEEQNLKKSMESVVLVKKFQTPSEDDSSPSNEPLPEIEARVSDKNVFIRIHCEKQKGVLLRALAAIEKLHLGVINSSTMAFGNSTLNITVVAQMEEEFNSVGKDLVESLRSALHQFIHMGPQCNG